MLSDFGVAYAVSQLALPYGVHASLAYLAPAEFESQLQAGAIVPAVVALEPA